MIPNNNLSVLPWYTSIEQQNARKWWVYNRIYPLFTPAGYLLPFQLMRVNRGIESALTRIDIFDDAYLSADGSVVEDAQYDTSVGKYDATGIDAILIKNYDPSAFAGVALIAVYDADDELIKVVLGADVPRGDYYCDMPSGASTACVVGSYDEGLYDGVVGYNRTPRPIESVIVHDAHTNDPVTGNIVSSLTDAGMTIKNFLQFGYDVIVFPAIFPVFQQFDNGQYYLVMTDGIDTWYSEVFTVVNDIQPYLKIEWYDEDDFVMDAGTIVYTNPAFKNVLYLKADIAKPEYVFEEEGETRDGYFFPTKQISEKRYRFAFLASEYLLDVMRFIRMADFASIEYHGQTYSLDTFLITPTWEDNGDVAAVEAEFDTATVAKKIGVGYIKAQRGDFNDDFNNDYLIQQ